MKSPAATKPVPTLAMKKRSLPLYEWVSQNNPPPEKEYGKGWWDAIEFYYRLAETFPKSKPTVIGTYVLQTPPPCEELILPTVRLRLPAATVVLQHDFALVAPYWTIAVKLPSRQPIDPFGLFDPAAMVPERNLERLPKAWRFQPMATDPQQFCCQVDDEFHVFTLLWMLGHAR